MNMTGESEIDAIVREQVIRDYLGSIGSIKTEKKAAASRANAAKAAEARRHPSVCTCGREAVYPLAHKGTCRVYQAEKARLRRAKKAAEQQ
jgi:hypothetical protein